MAAAELENILRKLLVSDNTVIQQGYLELKRAFAKPELVVPALADLLKSSAEPTIRQYCAILLRRRTVKHWKKLPVDAQRSLKNLLLECVIKESCTLVHNSICQVIGSIARHDLPSNNWPELMYLISSCVQSAVVNEREVGYSLLKFVSDMASEQLKPYYKELFPVFEKGLSDEQSRHCAFCTIKCLTSLLQYFGSDEEKLLKPLLGKVMDIIKYLVKEDEDKANEALDIFDELVQIEIGIIIPYVKQLVEFCMQIISCNELCDGLRVKALYLICWACRRKAKTLWKSNLLKPLVSLLLQLMSIPEEEDDLDNDDDEEGNETNSLPAVAAQALDLLALHSPPDKLIPILMESLSPLFSSENSFQRKAAYLALGELAEGCADYIRNRHLPNAVETCVKGLNDGSIIVRNAALFAMGQYAEHIQPEFGKFHETVLPMLLRFLHTVVNDSNAKVNHKGTLTKLFYAIEKFSEGLDKDIVKEYTSGLMDAFISLLKVSKTSHDKELAISAIGALVMSAQGHLSSYFPLIMENLKMVLMEPITVETLDIHSQTVDTLGALARFIDPAVFLPVANECMKFGIKMIEDCEDPDLRRCTYGLFASVSIVLKTEMTPYLPSIIPPMVNAIKSVEGIVPNYEANNDPSFLIEDDTEETEIGDNDNDDDDEDEENISGYTVENSYMEEKEDAINSIAEIAENVGNGIQTFLQEIYNEIFLLVDYPHCSVRKASVTASCRLCIVAYKIAKENSLGAIPVQEFISRSFPTAINVIRKDDDRSVVIACVEVLEELIKIVKSDLFLENKFIEELAGTILMLFKGQSNCQQFVEDDNSSTVSTDDDEMLAELDQMLVEKTGELLPSFASAIGGDNFKCYFNLYLPELMKKTKKNSSVSERSFAAGTVAEVIQAMEHAVTEYVPIIFPWLLGLLQDTNDEVRSNSSFALGVMAEHGKDSATCLYGNILQALFSMLSSEQQPPLVQDNVCGAVARMITASPGSLPLDQVLPILVGCLPIKEDESENETVTFCFIQLYATNSNMLLPYMEKLIPWFVNSVQDEKSGLTETTREQTKLLVADLEAKYPSEFKELLASKINGFQ